MSIDNITGRIRQSGEAIRLAAREIENEHVMGEALNEPIAELARLKADIEGLERLLHTREKAPA